MCPKNKRGTSFYTKSFGQNEIHRVAAASERESGTRGIGGEGPDPRLAPIACSSKVAFRYQGEGFDHHQRSWPEQLRGCTLRPSGTTKVAATITDEEAQTDNEHIFPETCSNNLGAFSSGQSPGSCGMGSFSTTSLNKLGAFSSGHVLGSCGMGSD